MILLDYRSIESKVQNSERDLALIERRKRPEGSEKQGT